MSELLLRRAPRPVCPFCKEEVAGGLIWVCPGCEASHHAECQTEHGACASCALAPAGRVDPKASAGHDEALAARRAELERLGFEVYARASGELHATHHGWSQPGESSWLAVPVTVRVLPVERLTVQRLAADRAALGWRGASDHVIVVSAAVPPARARGDPRAAGRPQDRRVLRDRAHALRRLRAAADRGLTLRGAPRPAPAGNCRRAPCSPAPRSSRGGASRPPAAAGG